jgi:hypothetical protein
VFYIHHKNVNRLPRESKAEPSHFRVVLDLSQHCAETAARREHARLRALLLDGGSERHPLGSQLELVLEFLETVDFRRLRRERPELAGGSPVWLEIRREGGNLVIAALDHLGCDESADRFEGRRIAGYSKYTSD